MIIKLIQPAMLPRPMDTKLKTRMSPSLALLTIANLTPKEHVVYKPKDLTAEELYNGYLWIYKEVYTFKNIMKRLPKSKKQWIPYLAFNLFYRKFGKLTELLCDIVSFKNIGRFFGWLAYRTK